ncbi:hypothetical protein BCV69DRAFT_283374 [Microstroma glucosiphilum]|uniref:Methyltransferase domain-containing protein n=1 Tax=Pseudomicrostroma glucosiphilum TaxID=1684307 RepID=A0A316U5L8_9BASI|nr:hypothetical protein BCV69DRAFT_283374 [Pseudomicrostroma glucosiphilum]PWN20490.1 hypothetical protein BCV69DRAFT_283374 [Pseudomicrostroma glucosiphilum]
MAASPPDGPTQPRLKYPDRQSLPGSAQRNVPVLVEAILPVLLPLLRTHEDEGEKAAASHEEHQKVPHGPSAPVRVLEIAAGHGSLTLALRRAVLAQPQDSRERHGLELPGARQKRRVQWTCTEADEALLQSIRSTNSQEEAQGAADKIAVARLEIDDESDWSALTGAEQGSPSAPAPAAASVHSKFDLVLIANLLHIVPFETVRSLFFRLRRVLSTRSGARVCIYGAFNEEGQFTSEGNQKFDQDLRSRNPLYGLRDLQGEILPLAEEHALQLEEVMRLARGNVGTADVDIWSSTSMTERHEYVIPRTMAAL